MQEISDRAVLLDDDECGTPTTDYSVSIGATDLPPPLPPRPDTDELPGGLCGLEVGERHANSSIQLASLYNHPHSGSLSSTRRSSNSSSRRRSRSRRRRRHRRSYKKHERNIPAALFSTLVIVTTATALAEPDWFYVSGSNCYQFLASHTFGVNNFFYSSGDDKQMKTNGGSAVNSGADCLSPQIIVTLKVVISLCFLAILFAVVAFLMDLIGPKNRKLKIIRRHGIWNIISLVFQILVCGLCYLISIDLVEVAESVAGNMKSKLIVRFSVSFYLIVGSACANIFASANNLLWRWPVLEEESIRQPYTVGSDVDYLPEMSPIRLAHPPPYAP